MARFGCLEYCTAAEKHARAEAVYTIIERARVPLDQLDRLSPKDFPGIHFRGSVSANLESTWLDSRS